jgi:hypothetical protein
LKKLLVILLILVLAVAFWFVFAIWAGIYSVYSIPPGPENPDGATLIVAREEGEPAFNSPAVKLRPAKIEKPSGIGFAPALKPKRPLDKRTVVELPFFQWAYEQSLDQTPEDTGQP